MAKIGARGMREVAKVKGTKTLAHNEGPTTFLFVLRSDGAILSRLLSYVLDDGSVHKVSSSYSIDSKGHAFSTSGAVMDPMHPLNVLSLNVERRGFTCEKAGR